MAETWWTAPAESEDGQLIMVTGRDDLLQQRESGKYPVRCTITWAYDGGMPSPELSRLMEQADDALRQRLKKDKRIILTGIYTGAGKREWVFYAKNVQVFGYLVNGAWAEMEQLPVELSAENDPDWQEYTEMRELTYIPPADD